MTTLRETRPPRPPRPPVAVSETPAHPDPIGRRAHVWTAHNQWRDGREDEAPFVSRDGERRVASATAGHHRCAATSVTSGLT
jgi:hypothetical protein